MLDRYDPSRAKHERNERAIWLTLVVLGVLVTAVVLSLGWRVVAGRLTAARRVDEAIATLKQTRATAAEVDTMLRAKVDTDTPVRAEQEIVRATQALARVDAIPAAVKQGADRLTDDERKQAVAVVAIAEAQSALLNEGIALLEAAKADASVRLVVDPAWDGTHSADKLAAQSVTAYDRGTSAGVRDAARLNTRAKDAYTTTLNWFKGAAKLLLITDFSPYTGYIEARLAALAQAQRANTLWLAGSRGQANALMAAYRATDTKLALRLQLMSSMPSELIDTAFKAALDSPTSAYVKARQAEQDAEARLQGF